MCPRKFLGLFAAGLIVTLVASSVADAQRRGGFGGGFGGGGKLDMLGQDDIRRELEIVDEQAEKLSGIRDEMRNRMREMFTGLRDLPEGERREAFGKMREKMGEIRTEMEAKVDGILLPNQIERLKQITFQSRTGRGGNAGLDNDQVAESLGITDEQKERLKEIAEKVQADLREKIQKLQAEAQEEILGVLTPEQREKYKKMAGTPFVRSQTRSQGRGGRPQGRGGRPQGR